MLPEFDYVSYKEIIDFLKFNDTYFDLENPFYFSKFFSI